MESFFGGCGALCRVVFKCTESGFYSSGVSDRPVDQGVHGLASDASAARGRRHSAAVGKDILVSWRRQRAHDCVDRASHLEPRPCDLSVSGSGCGGGMW